MKRLILHILLITCSVSLLNGQSITLKQVVLPTQGAHYRVGNTALSWTLGEPVGSAMRNGNLVLKPGFQQPEMPQQPKIPASQIVCSDTAYLFQFYGFRAGAGANKIEWSKSRDFDTTFIIDNADTIQLAINPSVTDTIWLRSLVTSSKIVSQKVFMYAMVNSDSSFSCFYSDTVCSPDLLSVNVSDVTSESLAKVEVIISDSLSEFSVFWKDGNGIYKVFLPETDSNVNSSLLSYLSVYDTAVLLSTPATYIRSGLGTGTYYVVVSDSNCVLKKAITIGTQYDFTYGQYAEYTSAKLIDDSILITGSIIYKVDSDGWRGGVFVANTYFNHLSSGSLTALGISDSINSVLYFGFGEIDTTLLSTPSDSLGSPFQTFTSNKFVFYFSGQHYYTLDSIGLVDQGVYDMDDNFTIRKDKNNLYFFRNEALIQTSYLTTDVTLAAGGSIYSRNSELNIKCIKN